MVYAAIRSALDVRLRITAHSASSALCGALHKAEFERSIIQKRIHAGIARAPVVRTKSGKPIGRAKVDRTRLQSSRSTFSCASLPSFFAFKEGMLETHISALLSSPTVSDRFLPRGPQHGFNATCD